MIRPRFEWVLPEPIDPPLPGGFGAPVATLLARRGLRTDDEVARFLERDPADLPPLALLPDAPAALARINAAIERRETIAIWGDYDADGMTAVAVWVLALRGLGVEPIRYVPSRIAEGYGLSEEGLARLAAAGVSLVVTCDCGVGNVAEVDAATALGLDVVVTDHHLPGPRLPDAVAVVDPYRPDSVYPDPDLTGAGVAFRLASALVAGHGRHVPDLAALAAIGTIADVAPMAGESRALVRLGLAELAVTEHPGLRGLLDRACEDPAHPTARDVAFAIVPRLNAAGRIAEAELALDVLVETDPEQATARLEALEAVHLRRRELTALAMAQAREMTADLAGVAPLVLRHDEWPAGILGLVAGRVADELVRPVVAAAQVGDEVRGSVRTTGDFHATAALAACAEHLIRRGGHAGAAGFSADPEAWDAFAAAFAALPRPFPAASVEPERPGRLAVDLVLHARHLGWALEAEIGRLAPFGPGNAEPMLAITGLTVGDARRVGAASDHVALRLRRGFETVDAIAFGESSGRDLPEAGTALDVVGYLERRTVEGEPRLRLRVLDYAASDASPLLGRRRSAAAPLPAGSP